MFILMSDETESDVSKKKLEVMWKKSLETSSEVPKQNLCS
jgi:hypothetical protein